METESDEARDILALQIAAEPDFVARHEALYQAMVEAQSRVRICPEPEYSLLVEAAEDARAEFEQHGRKIVRQYRSSRTLRDAELAYKAQVAVEDDRLRRNADAAKRYRDTNR